MSYKINSFLRNVSLYKPMLGIFILLCASSSAQSDNLKEKVSYIDCYYTMYDILSKTDRRYNISFFIDYPYEKLSKYSAESNIYIELCGTYKCSFTDNFINFSRELKDKKSTLIENTAINRWTGLYSEQGKSVYDGKVLWDNTVFGGCTGGVSKLKTKPRF